ncbi:hypothetical protein BJY52DRAFT_735863 [Lactarius psammicola]|nr:hypothetical protein BJY52DRAFT_735863 [Lactarius psammicola]
MTTGYPLFMQSFHASAICVSSRARLSYSEDIRINLIQLDLAAFECHRRFRMIGDYCNSEDEEEVIPRALDKACEPGIMFDRITRTQLSWSFFLATLYMSIFLSTSPSLLPIGSLPVSVFTTGSTLRREHGLAPPTEVVLEKKSSLSSASIHNEKQTPLHVDTEALVVNSTPNDTESFRRAIASSVS